MAIFTIGLFVSIWRGLMRFRRLARSIRTGASHVSFAQQNRVPELAPVAEEFDRMTMALQDSAESIRLAAEDNAHAFKTPIAIMRQSLEPLRRLVAPEEVRGQRRSEEHTSELQSLMRNSYAVFCLKKKKEHNTVTIACLTPTQY